MDEDPIRRRLGDDGRAFVAALDRVAYHAALKDVLDKVHGLIAAVQHASHMQTRAGIPDDAPLSDEERALFAASQSLVAQAARRDPGILMLFPPLPLVAEELPEPIATTVDEGA